MVCLCTSLRHLGSAGGNGSASAGDQQRALCHQTAGAARAAPGCTGLMQPASKQHQPLGIAPEVLFEGGDMSMIRGDGGNSNQNRIRPGHRVIVIPPPASKSAAPSLNCAHAAPACLQTCKGSGVQVMIRPLGPGMVQQIQQRCSTCSGSGSMVGGSCVRCRCCCLGGIGGLCGAAGAGCTAARHAMPLLPWLHAALARQPSCSALSCVGSAGGASCGQGALLP